MCNRTERVIEKAEPDGIKDGIGRHRQNHDDGREHQEVWCEAISQIQVFSQTRPCAGYFYCLCCHALIPFCSYPQREYLLASMQRATLKASHWVQIHTQKAYIQRPCRG